jgi:hypothetical protein
LPASRGASRAHHSEHYHGFAQIRFILKGEFTIDGRLCPPSTMLYHPDPHFEGVFRTVTGGEILIMQYPGPSRPICAGRFNMEKRKAVADERVDLRGIKMPLSSFAHSASMWATARSCWGQLSSRDAMVLWLGEKFERRAAALSQFDR